MQELESELKLPIVIGAFEAQAIALELEKDLIPAPPRPLTHDLFKNFARVFGVNVTKVVINKLTEGVFHSYLFCEQNGVEHTIDARTSDAIAIALRFKAPIDSNIPTEQGMLPSSGALTAFIQYATQIEPIVMGKPFSPILEGGLKRLGLSVDEVLMIGDNYETDIKVGINAGMDTLLVLTGFTQLEDLAQVAIQPTYVREDLSKWEI